MFFQILAKTAGVLNTKEFAVHLQFNAVDALLVSIQEESHLRLSIVLTNHYTDAKLVFCERMPVCYEGIVAGKMVAECFNALIPIQVRRRCFFGYVTSDSLKALPDGRVKKGLLTAGTRE